MCSHDTSSYDFFIIIVVVFLTLLFKSFFFYEYNFMFTKAVFFYVKYSKKCNIVQ